MKRGRNIAVLALSLWATQAWSNESENAPSPSKPHTSNSAEAVSAFDTTPIMAPSTIGAMKKETYYHFFLEDYLTSATRLKLLEASVHDDPATMNHIRLLRGSLYVVWGMHRPATDIFDQLVSVFPPGQDRNQVLLLIERLQYSRALYEAAIATYERITPDAGFASMDHAAYLAGMSHYALGHFDRALSVMTTIQKSSDYAPFAKLTSAQSHNQLADVDDAIHLLNEVGSEAESEDMAARTLSEKSRLTLGLLLAETGRYDEALQSFASVPQNSPYYPDAVFGKGWAYLYQQRYAESLAAFLTLRHAAPDHPYALEALTTIGHCYDRMGARGEAFRAYGKALDTYRHEERTLDEMRGIITNRDRLGALITDFSAVPDSPLGPLLDDGGLRFWIKQYSELGTIEQYLTRKLDDMAVFEVMVDHREAVFRDRLPVIRQFLTESPTAPLRQRQEALQATADLAIQHETAEAWAFGSEAAVLDKLARTRRQSQSVGAAIAQINASTPSDRAQRDDLTAQWKAADRWLAMLHGEQTWKILTEIPGRRDDLQRTITHTQLELDKADRNQRVLIGATSGQEIRINEFRQRIETVRQDIVAHRARLVDLRAQLLPPLQTLLSNAVDRRSSQMEAMAAAAQLSQVHIMDILTQ